jgi:hypothetical protein
MTTGRTTCRMRARRFRRTESGPMRSSGSPSSRCSRPRRNPLIPARSRTPGNRSRRASSRRRRSHPGAKATMRRAPTCFRKRLPKRQRVPRRGRPTDSPRKRSIAAATETRTIAAVSAPRSRSMTAFVWARQAQLFVQRCQSGQLLRRRLRRRGARRSLPADRQRSLESAVSVPLLLHAALSRAGRYQRRAL